MQGVSTSYLRSCVHLSACRESQLANYAESGSAASFFVLFFVQGGSTTCVYLASCELIQDSGWVGIKQAV